jgi:glutaredoxin-like protein
MEERRIRMDMLNKEVREATGKKFEAGLVNPVSLVFFTQEPSRLIVPNQIMGQECLFCKETRQLLEEVASLSEKISLTILDFTADKDRAAEYGADKLPALIVRGDVDSGIRFFGIPSGYEYMSLIEAIIDVSKVQTGLKPETRQALKGLEKDVHIQVFVTPTCPYCTTVVRLAHQFALESPRIKGEMVEATEFPHLAQKYHVFGVPKAVINETVFVEGAVPETVFLERVLQAAGSAQK